MTVEVEVVPSTPEAPAVVPEVLAAGSGTVAPEPVEDDPLTSTKHPAIRIELLEKASRITLANGLPKMISHTELAKVIQSYLQDEEAISNGTVIKFPPGVYAQEISATSLVLGIYHKTCIRDVNFGGVVKKRVIPNVVMTVYLKKAGKGYRVDKAYYFCTNRSFEEFNKEIIKKVDRATGITILPFSNVYDSGLVCVGTNGLTMNYNDGDLRGLNWHYEFLWQTPFNHDLGVKAIRSGSFSVDSWFEHLHVLATQDKPFPYEFLGI